MEQDANDNKKQQKSASRLRRFTVGSLTLICVLALAGYIGFLYVKRHWNLDKIAQHYIIPQLEEKIGQPITVEKITSNYVNRIRLRGVEVGKNKDLPSGALFRAQSVIIDIDLPSIAFKRKEILQAINAVAIHQPILYLARDENGKFNLADIIESEEPPSELKWTGNINVKRGTLIYEDQKIRNSHDQALIATLQNLDGLVKFNDENPIIYRARVPKVLLRNSENISDVSVDGIASSNTEWLQNHVYIKKLPATPITDYLIHNKQLAAQRGTLAGRININWEKESGIDFSGNAQLKDVTAQLNTPQFVKDLKPISLQHANGGIRFDKQTVTLQKLQVETLGSSLELDGNAAFDVDDIPFDISAKSQNMAFTQLGIWLNPLLPSSRIQGDAGILDLRIFGTAKRISTRGKLVSRRVFLEQKDFGQLNTASLDLNWDGVVIPKTRNHDLQTDIALKFRGDNGTITHTQGTGKFTDYDGQLRAQNNADWKLLGQVSGRNLAVATKDNESLQSAQSKISFIQDKSTFIRFEGDRVTAKSQRYGSARGERANLQVVIADKKTDLQGTFQRLVVESPEYGNAAADNAKIQSVITDGKTDAKGEFRRLSVKNAQYGDAVAGNARLQATFAGKEITAQGLLQTLSVKSKEYGDATAQNAAVQIASIDEQLTAQGIFQQIAAQSSRYGNATAKQLQIRATEALSQIQKGRAHGDVVVQNADITHLNRAAISPDLARYVSDVGSLDGTAQFALNEKDTIINGDFQLRNATVRQDQKLIPLRQIKSTFNYANRFLQVNNVSAQSPYGDLQGEVLADFQKSTFTALLQIPRAHFDAKELNPYLENQRIHLDGAATGRILLAANSADNTEIQSQFDLQISSPKVLFRQAQINAQNVHLRGQVDGNLRDEKRWNFTSRVALAGKQGIVQQEQNTAHLVNFRLVGQGNIDNEGGEVNPQLQGTLDSGTIKIAAADVSQSIDLSDFSSKWQWQNDTFSAPRLAANFAGGEIDGHATLRDGERITGEFLGRNLALQEISQWLEKAYPDAIGGNSLSGNGFIKANLSGTLQRPTVGLDSQIYDGELTWKEDQIQRELPLDMAFIETSLTLDSDKSTFVVPLQKLTLWSAGTRLDATGNVRYLVDKSTFSYDADVDINGMQLVEAIDHWPLLKSLQQWREESETRGVMDANLHLVGEGDRPQIDGTVKMHLAQSYNTSLRNVESQVTADFTNKQPVIRLVGMQGNIAESPFTADFTLDMLRETWVASADITDIGAADVLDFSEELIQNNPRRGELHLSRLPIRGKLNAQLQAHGTLKTETDETTQENYRAIKFVDGTLNITSPQVSWRNDAFGTLKASFQLKPDHLQIRQIALDDEGDPSSEKSRQIRVTGAIPWDADSPEMNTQVKIDNVRYSFLSQLLDQTRSIWRRTGQRDVWQQLEKIRDDLPPETEGNISLDSRVTGRRIEPQFEVASLQVRDVSARAPDLWGQGPKHPLPNIDASGTYKNGLLTISTFEARLSAENPDQDDLLLQSIGTGSVEIGGNIDLNLQLLHGKLSDLALWMPSLRKEDGSAVLHGNIGLAALHVEGKTNSPHVVGSIDADSLTYQQYALDRLRVSRFDITDNALTIRPGNFTIVKGTHQSSTGWGMLPWSWGGEENAPLGLVRNRPMEVHLPLKNEDFGTLVSLFVPDSAAADAEEFEGSIDITGTLDNPQFDGNATIKGGKYMLATAPGVENLSGTLRFMNGSLLQIDPQNPLRGKIQSVTTLQKITDKSTFIPTASGAPYIAGDFQLAGSVDLDLEAIGKDGLQDSMSAHRYDLQMAVRNGILADGNISGLRRGNLGMIWQTGAGNPTQNQRVRWILSGKGIDQKGNEQGDIRAFGDFSLDPEFATNWDKLLSVHSNSFTRSADFTKISLRESESLFGGGFLNELDGKLGQIQLHNYGVAVKDSANGRIDGTLNLQNAANGKWEITGELTVSNSKLFGLPQQPEEKTRNGLVQISTAGASTNSASISNGTALNNTMKLNAPTLDIEMKLGDDVDFDSSNLRATLSGDLSINGTPSDPLIIGTFTIRRGNIIFPGARARIKEGNLGLFIRRDPLTGNMLTRTDIDATAEGRSGRYLITLRLHGPLNTGQEASQTFVDISSDPPLSQDEAFAQLLGTAALNARDSANHDQAYAQLVIGALSGPLLSGVETKLADALGLSSIALDYRLNEPIGVEIGKALGDRLYLSYRRSLGKDSISDETPYELRLDYRIRGNWQLGIKTNERDERSILLEKRWRF